MCLLLAFMSALAETERAITTSFQIRKELEVATSTLMLGVATRRNEQISSRAQVASSHSARNATKGSMRMALKLDVRVNVE